MVLIKRRSMPAPLVTSNPRRSSSSSIAYGDGEDVGDPMSPPVNISPESMTPGKFSFEIKTKKSHEKLPPWAYKALVCLVVLSWIYAAISTSKGVNLLREMEQEEEIQKIKYEENIQELRMAKESHDVVDANVKHLIHARHVMSHEERMAREMVEVGGAVPEFTNHGTIKQWHDKRQEKLKEKVDSLKEYVQHQSMQEAIKQFGPGPHRVKFTVQFVNDSSMGSFLVEMAPLNLMPHAVHNFLLQVSKRLWDNTVFWHHDGVDHIMSATAVEYHSGDSKHHYFEHAVGVLSFGEYSPLYPHEQFTLGFAGRGPDFYINAVDNTKLHGPGGQGHHELKDEADPCFAKVVEGFDTIHKMNELQILQSKEAMRRRAWHENQLTKIHKVEIV